MVCNGNVVLAKSPDGFQITAWDKNPRKWLLTRSLWWCVRDFTVRGRVETFEKSRHEVTASINSEDHRIQKITAADHNIIRWRLPSASQGHEAG